MICLTECSKDADTQAEDVMQDAYVRAYRHPDCAALRASGVCILLVVNILSESDTGKG